MRFFQKAAKFFALAGMTALCLTGTASAGVFGDSGLFAVCVDGYYPGYGGSGCGYINEQGEWAITPRFDAANPFMTDGTAWVQKSGRGEQPNRVGRIDKNGEWVTSLEYEGYWLFPIGKGVACSMGRSSSSGFINERGKIIPSKFRRIGKFSENGLATATREAPYGYINRQGEWIIQPIFREARQFDANGLAKVETWERSGFINLQGEWVAAPDKAQVFAPEKGSGGVQSEKEASGSGLSVARAPGVHAYGYVDSRGEWVIKPIFSVAYDFSDGLARVCYGSRYGFINVDGTWAIPPNFAMLGDFSRDGLTLARASHNSGFINTNGEWVVPPMFQSVGEFDAGAMAAAEFEGKYGYIDINGKWVLPPVYDEVGEFGANGLATAKQDGTWGYVDREGKWVAQPQHVAKAERVGENGLAVQADFREAGDFAENGLAFAQKEELYGYIDAQGQWAIEPRFRRAKSFASNGLAAAQSHVVTEEEYQSGYIDSSGAWVIPPRYTTAGDFTPYGLAHVSVGHSTYFHYFNIDATGTPRVPLGFYPENLPQGVRWKYEESGNRALLDAEGRTLLAVGRRCGEDVITNAAGKIIWPLDGVVPACGEKN